MIINFHPDAYKKSELPEHLHYHSRKYEGKKMIGFWTSKYYREKKPDIILPDPKDFIDPTWDEDEKKVVLAYLSCGQKCESWRGFSNCRLCGKMLGSHDMTDGLYIWPEGFEHYIDVHDLRVPDEFVQHCITRFSTAM